VIILDNRRRSEMGFFNKKTTKKTKTPNKASQEELLKERQVTVDQLFKLRMDLYNSFYLYVDRSDEYFYGKSGEYTDAIGNVAFEFPEILEYAKSRDKQDGGDSYYYENLYWEFYMSKLEELKVHWDEYGAPLTTFIEIDQEPEHAEIRVVSPQFQDFLVGAHGHHAVKTEESLILSIDLLSTDKEGLLQTWEVDDDGNFPWLNDNYDIAALSSDYDYGSFLDPNGVKMEENVIDTNLSLFEDTLINSITLINALHEAIDSNINSLTYMKQLMDSTKLDDFLLFMDKN